LIRTPATNLAEIQAVVVLARENKLLLRTSDLL